MSPFFTEIIKTCYKKRPYTSLSKDNLSKDIETKLQTTCFYLI